MYQKMIRPFARQAAFRLMPAPHGELKKIAVVGLPRSGTSWLAKAISLADKTQYYYEPDQRFDRAIQFPYIAASELKPDLIKHVNDSFGGKILDAYTITEQGLMDIIKKPFAETVLVKWVRFLLLLEWIAKNYTDVMVVQIIRHPAPLFLSWKSRGWNPEYALMGLLEQSALMDGPLNRFKATMQKAESFWQKSGAFWGAVTYMQLLGHQKHWILKQHEWYCESSKERIRWLLNELGLEWNGHINDFLSSDRKKSSGPGYGARRNSLSEINKWRSDITSAELNDLLTTTAQFDLEYYQE